MEGSTRLSKDTLVPLFDGDEIRGLFLTVREYKTLELLESPADEPVILRTTVCAWCKNVKKDDNSWIPLHEHLRDKLNIYLSHGICQSCVETEMN